MFNVLPVCVTYIRFAPDLNKTRGDLVPHIVEFHTQKRIDSRVRQATENTRFVFLFFFFLISGKTQVDWTITYYQFEARLMKRETVLTPDF